MKKRRAGLFAFGFIIILLLVLNFIIKDPNTVRQKYTAAPQFSNCSSIFINGLLRYEKTDNNGVTRYGYIDEDGKIITDAVFDDTLESVYFSSAVNPLYDVPETPPVLIPVKKGEKWGYIDRNGKVRIDFKYDRANVFSEGKACVKLDNKWGYINTEGKSIIPFTFDEAYNFIHGVSCVASNDKYGFINDEGNWLVKPAYSYLNSAVLGYRADNTDTIIFAIDFAVDEHQGLLKIENNSVKILAEPIYRKIFPFRNGEALYYISEKDAEGNDTGRYERGYLDESGEKLISWSDGQEGVYGLLSEGLRAAFDKNNRWGYIDKDKTIAIPFTYDKAEDFWQGGAIVCKNNKYGIIDGKNHILLDIAYDSISRYVDSCMVAEKDGYKQLIDTKTFKPVGKIYKEILLQDNNFAIFNEKDKFGLMNNKGVEVILPSYESADQLSSIIKTDIDTDGFWLKQGDQWAYMDFNGHRKVSEAFDDAGSFRFGYAPVKKDDQWGLIDKNGNRIVDYKFEEVFVLSSYMSDSHESVSANMAAVRINNKLGLVSLQGR